MYLSLSLYIYIYIYIYTYLFLGHKRCVLTKCRKEPVRFDSFRFRTCFRKLIGSVRFGKTLFPDSTRFGLRFSDVSWLGPVRFGSFPRPLPAGSRIKTVWFGSVWPVRFGFLLLPVFLNVRRGSASERARAWGAVWVKSGHSAQYCDGLMWPKSDFL